MVFIWLVRGEVAGAIKWRSTRKSYLPAPVQCAICYPAQGSSVKPFTRRALGMAPSYERGKLAMAKRSSLPGSFTTLHSLLKIMVARVLVS